MLIKQKNSRPGFAHRINKLMTACAFSSILLLSPMASAAWADEPYKVASGDVLLITVYGDTGLSGTFPVSVEGTIGYPILGNIP
ncbi:polysaccharide biosynthesis/export family protein, partial [Phyllobacterium sp. P5_D12]